MTIPERLTTTLADRYGIQRELGQGGMATVYLADDLKHDRRVALKVLKPELAAVVGGERFVAEIRTTANLQHPHILPLFDSGQSDGFLWYVMPYVEGETLRDRLDREKQLPVGEAVAIAQKVAGALQAAHEKGVIHRDIKPANILMQSGEPVVSDFGIALAVQQAGQGRLTETGLSMGTPYYMSPEQATGDRDPDARSDVYSLACVLYEMLTGEPPHAGSTAQAVLAKILTGTAARPVTLRESIPPAVDVAIMRALAKLPADRFGSASAFGAALTDPTVTQVIPSASSGESAGSRPGTRTLAAGALLAVGGFAAGALLWGAGSAPPAPTPRFVSIAVNDSAFVMDVPINADRPSTRILAFSPDGLTLVHQSYEGDQPMLYRRRLDRQDASEPIAGTEGARLPFFSPDGSEIGFWAAGYLRRVPIEGGTPVEIAAIPWGGRLAVDWGDRDEIVIGGVASIGGLARVAASGGSLDTLVTGAHTTPSFLPGGEALLFTARSAGDLTQRQVVLLDLDDMTLDTLLDDAADARYISSGHLIFARRGTLMQVPFDLESRELGPATGVVADVMQGMNGGNTGYWSDVAQVSISAAGHLAYLRGGITPDQRFETFWFDRSGQAVSLGRPPETTLALRLSPSGDQIASTTVGSSAPGLWASTVNNPTRMLRLVEDGVATLEWTPDGTEIVYPAGGLFLIAADGTTPPRQISESGFLPLTWEGESLIVFSDPDLLRLDIETGETTPFLSEQQTLTHADVSPDGRWLLYRSGDDIVVRSLPLGPDRRVVLTGTSPTWSPAGDEIIYATIDSAEVYLYTATFDTETGLVGNPVMIPIPDSDHARFQLTRPFRSFDVDAEGRILGRLGQIGSESHPPEPEIQLILNWFDPKARR